MIQVLGSTSCNSLSGVVLTHLLLENLWSGCTFSVVFICFVLVSQQAFSNSVCHSSKLDLLSNICLGIALSLLVIKNIQETCVHEAGHSEEVVREKGLSASQLQKTVPALLVCGFGAELSHMEQK